MAWVGGDWCDPARQQYGGMKAVVQQLRENPGLFTGIMGFCGYAFAPNGTVYIKNTTRLACCNGTLDGGDLFAEVRRQGMEFQPVMYLDDPIAAATAPAPYVEAFAARAAAEGWPGFNLDWEGGATTGNLSNFLRFCGLMDGLVLRSGARTLQNSRDPLLCTAHTFGPGGWNARERPPLLVRHSVGDAAVAWQARPAARCAARRQVCAQGVERGGLQSAHPGFVRPLAPPWGRRTSPWEPVD